jgi:hypothetical protein
LIVTERPQARDDRERDIGQHHHLQQLDEAVRYHLEHAGVFAEKQSDEGAGYESNKDFGGRTH